MNAERRIINQINNKSINEDCVDFNTSLKTIIMQYTLEEIEKEIVPIIANNKYDIDVQFTVYYAVFIYYRRFEFHTKLYHLVDTFSSKFKSKRFNSIVLSQYYKFKFIDTNEINFAYEAIENSRTAISVLSDNSGVLHNFAELVASFLESDIPIKQDDVSAALRFIDRAIELNRDYPKLYATKGRLLSFTGDYENAKINIRKAIDYEDSDGKDSLMRISQYYNSLIDIKTRENIELVINHLKEADQRITEGKKSSKQMIDKMETMQTRYLELLAFFSGILSLIISVVVEIGTKIDSFNQMVGVTLTLGGVLLLSFTGLRFMISNENNKNGVLQVVCMFFFSLLMIALGIIIGNI